MKNKIKKIQKQKEKNTLREHLHHKTKQEKEKLFISRES